MKIRYGFVSNSSSSSFVLDTKYLSEDQIKLIVGHRYCKTIPYAMSDQWDIHWSVDDRYIVLDTIMDNFDMYEYLTSIVGVNEKQIMYEIPSEPEEIKPRDHFCDEAKRILEVCDETIASFKADIEKCKRYKDEN